jgi:membrane dipeptidase
MSQPVAIFDGHNDVLTRADHAGLVPGRAGGHLDLPRMAAGGMRGGVFAVFTGSFDMSMELQEIEPGVVGIPYAEPIDQQASAAYSTGVAGRLFAAERGGHLTIARSIADLDAARTGDGPPVAVLSLEGAEAIDTDLESLETWYAAGLRLVGPVWSRPNDFASGVPFRFPSSPDTGPGLTAAGFDLVKRCAELGILVDVSHLNEAGFWDLAKLDLGPIVASHSGVHAIAGASRNLTDAQLDAIGASNGLVGIVYAVEFLRPDFKEEAETPLELIVEHARYVRDRIGIDHVALGSDFDGATIPAPLGGADGLPRLIDAFRTGGFTDAEIEQVAWTNWRRVFDAWWH